MKIIKLLIILIVILFITMPLFSYTWEGFERENLWLVTVQDKNAVNSIQTTTTNASEGKYSLVIDIEKTTSENSEQKGFISRDGLFDLTGIEQMQFNLYSEMAINVSIGLSTGKTNEWFESQNFKLTKGWNRDLTVSLNNKKWKSGASHWENIVNPKNLDKVRKITFLFFNAEKGRVYLDDIRFSGAVIKNDAYTMPYEPIDPSKLVDESKLLVNLIGAGWASEKNMEVKKENNLYILGFKEVNNINKAAYKIQSDLDWSGYSRLICKVNNLSKDFCGLALGVQTGNSWEWYESPIYLLKPNKTQNVVFLLNGFNFKSEETGWKYITFLYNKNLIKCFNFLIYGVQGKINSGAIRLEKPAIYAWS